MPELNDVHGVEGLLETAALGLHLVQPLRVPHGGLRERSGWSTSEEADSVAGCAEFPKKIGQASMGCENRAVN